MDYEAMIEHCSVAQLRALLMVAVEEPERTTPPAEGMPSRGDLERCLRGLDAENAETAAGLLSARDLEAIPLPRLRALKDVAKRLRGQNSEPADRRAATLLYHLSAAAAWAIHGVNISSRSASARAELYEKLAEELADDGLARLLSRASRRIRARERHG